MAARINNSSRSKAKAKSKSKSKRKPKHNPVHMALGIATVGVVAAALVNGAIDVGRAITA